MKTTIKEIPIFFASDDNYVPLLATAIKSLLTNASKEYTYKIYVLTTNMSQDKREKIAEMATSNSTIEFIALAKELDKVKHLFRLRDYYSKETYYRFFIPDLFPKYKKVIYLDCDLIILGDISDLYYTNISNYLVAAAHEQTFSQFPPFDRYPEEVLGVKLKNAFNAGMLLINAKMFRAYNIQQRFFNPAMPQQYGAGKGDKKTRQQKPHQRRMRHIQIVHSRLDLLSHIAAKKKTVQSGVKLILPFAQQIISV